MASPRRSLTLFRVFTAAAVVAAAPLTAQTMVEYGHMAAGAAKGASSLRKATPGATFRRTEGALSAGQAPSLGAVGEPSNLATWDSSSARSAIAVLRVDWEAPDAARGAPNQPDAETVANKNVLEDHGAGPGPDRAPDLAASGLSIGMHVAQVSKILGDPAVRTAGLEGRGYDEKRLYRFSEAWRVMVFAARGSVTALVPSPAPKKSANRVLSDGDSVIP